MRGSGRAIAAFLLAWLLLPTLAVQAWDPPPTPNRWVTDQTGFLSPGTAEALDRDLAAHAQSSGQQVLVWIGATSKGVPIEEWAARTFQAWRVGRKGIDDGVLIFVLSEDRRVRIEVGYGLESKLPDLRAAAIIRDVITPRLAKADRDGAVRAAVGAVLEALSASPRAVDTKAPSGLPELSWFEWAGLAAFVLLFVVLLITHPGLAAYLLITMATGGRGHRGGGGGFGGFRGGGGRSGGGGASGSW